MALPILETNNEKDVVGNVSAGRRDEEEGNGSDKYQVRVYLASGDDSAATPGRIVGSAAGGLMSSSLVHLFVDYLLERICRRNECEPLRIFLAIMLIVNIMIFTIP
mmetsp:Transcript_4686/g.5742  ORF Transcript_4686/g.5742 Transcript_4686/m.5742 type:complete len:106 (-) Transcript_4686:6-323(-)